MIVLPNRLPRRTFLSEVIALGTAAYFAPGVYAQELTRTPDQTEGPFYPDRLPLDHDNDLTMVAGHHAPEAVTDGIKERLAVIEKSLPELEMMNGECRRLSGGNFLLIPGEEGNDFLGIKEPGKHPGHWMLLFPKPVHWTVTRMEAETITHLVMHSRLADQEKSSVWPRHVT